MASTDPLFWFVPDGSLRFPIQFDKRSKEGKIIISDDNLEMLQCIESNARAMCL